MNATMGALVLFVMLIAALLLFFREANSPVWFLSL